jgi:hypothetical protein
VHRENAKVLAFAWGDGGAGGVKAEEPGAKVGCVLDSWELQLNSPLAPIHPVGALQLVRGAEGSRRQGGRAHIVGPRALTCSCESSRGTS